MSERQCEALFHRVHRFIGGPAPWQCRVSEFLNKLKADFGDIYVVGGALRDLAIFGSKQIPRDLDLVVGADIDVEQIEVRFRAAVRRRTRFGGVQLSIGGLHVDVWPLKDTWPIRAGEIQDLTPRGLAMSAFLNTEAICFCFCQAEAAAAVYDAGLFDAIKKQQVEINLESGPSPAHCVIHALAVAERTGYAIGPKLAEFIARHQREVLNDAEAIQEQRFGSVKFSAKALQRWIAMEDLSRAPQLAPSWPSVQVPLLAA